MLRLLAYNCDNQELCPKYFFRKYSEFFQDSIFDDTCEQVGPAGCSEIILFCSHVHIYP